MIHWLEPLLDDLANDRAWTYQPGGTLAAEPAALAALALVAHGRRDAAEGACRRLALLEVAGGGIAVTARQPTPGWATAWAVLAWSAVQRAYGGPVYQDHVERAVGWILAMHGRTSAGSSDLGHNTRLDGWPWVEETHAWVEPTALSVLALKRTGRGRHPRCREGVAMLIDRLLPEGGCNYGNTSVFGQVLRPHLEPSGLTMIALADESDPSGRIERSLSWLQQAVARASSAASLAYGLLGLAAHGRRPPQADDWLRSAARRKTAMPDSPLRKGLLALAAAQPCPL
ncbi:MAG: hypothetical protein B7Z73_08675 [Planctomycetia bacterium 21-64-5]|nr:MAG: hypothetical protein B7Z73_08675 [Planctomycetia bacterium 21-64-5]HQU43090.1 hypothetical protein [Pirellulales bacterium]